MLAIVLVFFRRVVAWAVLAALSAALHLFGANVHLPHVSFGWPWSSTTTNTLVGPIVLQKIEGIDKPALGTANFDFVFTRKVTKNIGFLPCWYSATFAAVGRASATVDLNPGTAWWKSSTGHYQLRVLSQPAGSIPGKLAITMALPLPQLPQSVHDVSIDNTLSSPISTNHSWTYPGLACGALIQPAVRPVGALRAGPDRGVHPGHDAAERHQAADRRGREGSHHDHPRQFHRANGGRAQLQRDHVLHPLGAAGRIAPQLPSASPSKSSST